MTQTATQSQRADRHSEEVANALTHAAGLILAIVGAADLSRTVLRHGTTGQIWACGIYAGTLVATYVASTLSHVFRSARLRSAMRTADQAAIFLLIGGTYTPLAVTWLHGGAWWILNVAMAALTIGGFLSKAVWTHRVGLGAVSTILYVILGGLPLPMLWMIPGGLIRWVLGGDLCLCLGIVFFNFDHRIRYFHAVWHLLVMAGTVCHFIGILLFCTTPHGLGIAAIGYSPEEFMFYIWIVMLLIVAAIIVIGFFLKGSRKTNEQQAQHGFAPGHPIDR